MALEVEVMKNKFQTLKSCRTCMASEEKMNDIFSSQHNGIAIKIQYCTGLVVTKNDELPSLICDKCLQNLITAYHFKTTSLHSDKSLRDILLNSKKEKTEEIEIKTIKMEDLEHNKWTKPMDNINCNYSNGEKYVETDCQKSNLNDSFDVDQNDVIYNYLSVELVHDEFNLSFNDKEINNDSNTSDCSLNDGNVKEESDLDTKGGTLNIIPTDEQVFLKSNLRKNKNIESADSNVRAAEMKIQSLPGVTVVKQEKPQVKLELLNCHQCKKKFTTLAELKLHKSKMHSRNSKSTATTVIQQSLSHMQPSCLLCFMKFNSVEELQQHRIEMHNSKVNVTSKATKLKQNIASVKSCIHCDVKFKTIKELRKHIKENHDSLGGTFCKQVEPTSTLTCFLCNIKFNTVMEIHKHWTEKHTQKNKKASAMETTITNRNKLKPICIPCNRKFDTIKELQKHTKDNHSKSGSKSVSGATLRKCNQTLNTTCSECDLKFDSITKYNQHRKEKHNQEGEGIVELKKPIRSSLKCIACNLTFNTKKEKRKHVRTTCIQSGQDGCMCEICGKLLGSRMSLYTHTRTHAPAAHACPHCPYRAALLFDLRKHMHVHTGEKNYKCKLCTREFATSSNLRLHERRWHTKEHRHQCQSCPKSFYDISSLKRHSTSHSGAVKQFQCDYCSSQFMHRNHWRRHVLSQHNVQVPKITVGRKRRNYIPQETVGDADTASQKLDSVKGTMTALNTN